jgi:hypothetical protein
MRIIIKLIPSLILVAFYMVINCDSVFSGQPDPTSGKSYLLTVVDRLEQKKVLSNDENYELAYKSFSARVSKELIRKSVFYLAQNPLPRRVYNWSLPGHKLSTLEEADIWIGKQLKSWGYSPELDETQVRAFGRDSSKPPHDQYAAPPMGAPFYTAHNIMAGKQGSDHPDQVIIIIAHKDSQSWIASPGANDNAIGTCTALELARVLKRYKPKHSIKFIFCNEEHTPWTSITAAEEFKTSGLELMALINLDAIGGKPLNQAGIISNVTGYTTPEGERLADLNIKLNERFAIGLVQTKYHFSRPGNDDGSFIKAGFPWAILNIGSLPYGDPNYHLEGDTADKADYESAKRVAQLTLALILYLDTFGRP